LFAIFYVLQSIEQIKTYYLAGKVDWNGIKNGFVCMFLFKRIILK